MDEIRKAERMAVLDRAQAIRAESAETRIVVQETSARALHTLEEVRERVARRMATGSFGPSQE